MKTHKAFGVIGATIVGVLAAQTAAAERPLEHGRTATVQVADLDLARESDVRVLYGRIVYAARTLCLAEESSFDAEKATRRRRCVETAIDTAVERSDIPLLMAVHLQQSERVARL